MADNFTRMNNVLNSVMFFVRKVVSEKIGVFASENGEQCTRRNYLDQYRATEFDVIPQIGIMHNVIEMKICLSLAQTDACEVTVILRHKKC